MPSRKEHKSKAKDALPRARRTRGTVRDAHYRSPQSDPASTTPHASPSARELYLREKERRAGRRLSPTEELVEEARQEFRALLAAEATSGKGGRPRKNPAVVAKPRTAIEGADIELDEVTGPLTGDDVDEI